MRPLLGCRRSEIEAFLRAQGYAWREDLTNQDSRYRRNALRKTILPLIESVFPDLRARILELGEEADRENRDLPHHQQAYSLAARDEVGGGISWDWDALSRAPVSVALRLIAARLARQAEAGHLPRRGVYRSLETRLASRSNVGGTLYQGRAGILMLNRSRLYCYPPLPPEFSQATKRQYSLKVGEFVFPWGRILVSEDDLPAAVDRNFFQEQAERAIFWVSMGVMQRDSILRMARPGDAIHCDGKRRQSVAELLSANGVPKPWRASALVLDGGDGCDALFVPAMLTKSRHGCTALVTADMRRALRLFFDRHETDTKDR